VRKIILSICLLVATSCFGQKQDYTAYLKQARKHLSLQQMLHSITWDHLNIWEKNRLDTARGALTLMERGNIAETSIQIIGRHDYEDSSFVWSIDDNSIPVQLTEATRQFKKFSDDNDWDLFKKRKWTFKDIEESKNFAAAMLYASKANGIGFLTYNKKDGYCCKGALFYLFYGVKYTARTPEPAVKLIKNPLQYTIVDEPGLIEFAKEYQRQITEVRKGFTSLSITERMDSMRYKEPKVAAKFWHPESLMMKNYIYYWKDFEHPENIIGWDVITFDDKKYVIYRVLEPWNSVKTYSFEIRYENGKPRIWNHAHSFF
jgi:hypothetical protein